MAENCAENWQSYSVVIPTGAGANATAKLEEPAIHLFGPQMYP